MTDFTYTDSLYRPNSSAVNKAYYNADDKSLLVVMRANGNAYKYDGVPSWVWTDFKGAASVGNFFANTIKRAYGPSKFAGIGKHLNIAHNSFAAPSMGSVSSIGNGYVSLAPAPRAAVGTPKGLTLASDASVTTKAEVFPRGVRKATTSVTFELLGEEKTLPLSDVSTTDEALAEFDRIANMLGVKAKVKAVTVHFE